MVDRWLFGTWIDCEIDNCLNVTSKTGWSALPDGYKQFWRCFPPEMTTLATDCSAFDWTYPAWVVKVLHEARKCQVRYWPPGYEQACDARKREVMGPGCIVRLPDGTRLIQLIWGIQKSGSLTTLSDNSAAQDILNDVALRLYCQEKNIRFPELGIFWAMGDDMIMEWNSEWDVQRFVAILNGLGVQIKSWTHESEFAGFRFGFSDVVNPAYPEKHKFLLGCKGFTQELVDALSLVYALSDSDMGEWLRYRQSLPPALTRAWARGLCELDVSHLVNVLPHW